MKALVWTAVNQLEIQDIERPKATEDEVLLRVSHVGICGTDLHIWRGEHPRAKPPLVMGHEFSAVVEDAGNSSHFKRGDGVSVYPVIGCGKCDLCNTGREFICGSLGLIGIDRNGGMGELVAVPERKLHRLPEGMDMAQAALIEPVAVGHHVMARCGFKAGITAAIVGAGPIGASVALVAKACSASHVLVSDVSDFRLGVVRELGFTAVNAKTESLLDAVNDVTNGRGAEFVFEATGIPAAAEGMQSLVAIGGTLTIVGVFSQPIPLDLRDILFREILVVGTRHYTPQEFDRAIALVASGRIDFSPLITDVYPLDRAVEAFERTGKGTDTEKVLIRVS